MRTRNNNTSLDSHKYLGSSQNGFPHQPLSDKNVKRISYAVMTWDIAATLGMFATGNIGLGILGIVATGTVYNTIRSL
jgi:hypothetical protein|tara:strand:- start:416 stop:649 length:234 start_codon:yes stop_codon:yes gene_type:complete